MQQIVILPECDPSSSGVSRLQHTYEIKQANDEQRITKLVHHIWSARRYYNFHHGFSLVKTSQKATCHEWENLYENST